MSVWIGVLIAAGAIIVTPLLIRLGLKAFAALTAAAGVGAFVGWLLDLAFDTYPTLTVAGAVVALVGLIGASLERLSGSGDE
ncbi:MAG: hypothetical protein ACE5G8_15265 [Anaerolineae bacterium]